MAGPLRVLVAEDSPLFVEALRSVIEAERDLEVCGVASDGERAVELCEALRPDLVTMDVRMPRMDGLEAIEEIMSRCPTPILVMTGDPRGETGELSFEALRRGALDLVCKPSLTASTGGWPDGEAEAGAFRARIRLLASIPVVHHSAGRRRRSLAPRSTTAAPRRSIVGIAASTGGPPALAQVLAALPPDYALPIAVVQHISAGFSENLIRWLGSVSSLPVQLAVDGRRLEPGAVWIAPDGRHLTVRASGRARLLDEPPVDGHRPSATVLLESLARSYGSQAAAVVLTGMGRDGATGLKAIRDAGGATAAQDRESSVVWGMPRAASELGAADRELALDQVAEWLVRLVPEPAR